MNELTKRELKTLRKMVNLYSYVMTGYEVLMTEHEKIQLVNYYNKYYIVADGVKFREEFDKLASERISFITSVQKETQDRLEKENIMNMKKVSIKDKFPGAVTLDEYLNNKEQ